MTTDMKTPLQALPEVRDDFIPAEHYVSPAVVELEAKQLWTRSWQMACREEDIPVTGNYILYEVADQSIIVLRTATGIKAYHNVCPHRGNQLLTAPSGNVTKFYCSFHGWQWNTEGKSTHIKDEQDWAGCPAFSSAEMNLKPVHTGFWGGFVFINMAQTPIAFETFIAPVERVIGCVEFETMRTKWHKTMILRGNWKTALESFMESYHVYTTHFQLVPYFDELSYSKSYGQHGMHGYPATNRPLGAPAARTGQPIPQDLRPGFVQVLADLAIQTGGTLRVGSGSGRSADAVTRLLTELPATAGPMEIFGAAFTYMREAAEAEGAGWPTVSPEQMAILGVDWNIFPNMILVFVLDSTLVFRARPNGDDPHSCIFEMSGLLRCAPKSHNAPVKEYYEDWQAHKDDIPSLLVQDLYNIEKIQKGMRSVVFPGSRTNPVQERQISHHHRVLRSYLRGGDGTDAAAYADDAQENSRQAAE